METICLAGSTTPVVSLQHAFDARPFAAASGKFFQPISAALAFRQMNGQRFFLLFGEHIVKRPSQQVVIAVCCGGGHGCGEEFKVKKLKGHAIADCVWVSRAKVARAALTPIFLLDAEKSPSPASRARGRNPVIFNFVVYIL
ncbi:MAG: hypothetical protein R3C19_00455 [Planctomycetaceae bacterium]